WRNAALGCFDDAFGIGLGLSARAEDVIIAGHLSFHRQLPAGVTRQRVEKEDGAENGLKEIDVMVAPLNVRQLVSQHRGSLRRGCPSGDVSREHDHRAQYAEQYRRTYIIQYREVHSSSSQCLAVAFIAIEIGQGGMARAGL